MRTCRTCLKSFHEDYYNKIRSTYNGPNGIIKYEHHRLDCKRCHADKKYRKMIMRNYNLTMEDFQNLITKQNNKCKICETLFSETTPFVDHCHTTGKVRGLLCTNCNFGIGQFKDSIDLLQAAIEYLKA